jgi:hypothetical protein
MTIEKKCFIRPEDIVSVQFQCANCKAAVTVPVGKGDIGFVITRACPHCRKESGFQMGMQDLEQFIVFNDLLGKLTGILQGKNLQFSLQVECDQ